MKRGSGFQGSIVLLCVLLSPLFLIAQGHKGKHKKGAAENHTELLAFSPHDQQVVRDYFRVNTNNLPPGLAKRGGSLPPGLEKQLQKKGTLPPGLEKRIEPLPLELERRLPPLPSGYTRRIIGVQALILDSQNIIQDLMLIR